MLSGVNLPEKDQPILAAAFKARATHLLTGDRRHFGECFGKRICGVLIQTAGPISSQQIEAELRTVSCRVRFAV